MTDAPRPARTRLQAVLAHVEARTLVILLLMAAALWGFAALASEVVEGDAQAFDEGLLLALRSPGDLSDPIGPRGLEEAMRDITALGGATWLLFLSASVIVYLSLRGQARSGLLLLVAVVGGQVLSHLAKYGFARPRPDLVPHGSYVYTSSFPSGHSMMAAVTYLTLAVMIVRIEPRRRLRAFYFALAVILTVAVGISRVYLGVHWPSDVLAGWMAGAAWALACYLVAEWLARRGDIEPSRGEPGPGET